MTEAAAEASIEARLAAAGLPPLRRTTWLEIDTDALASNLRLVRTLAPPGRAPGGGPEGQRLRPRPGGRGPDVRRRRCRPAVRGDGRRGAAPALDRPRAADPRHLRGPARRGRRGEGPGRGAGRRGSGRSAGPPCRGRGRLGESPCACTWRWRPAWCAAASSRPRPARRRAHPGRAGRRLAGLWTHFASSHDPAATARQRQRFDEGVASVRAHGVAVPPRAWAASGGLLADAAGDSEFVRPGLVLYGMPPDGFPVAPRAAAAAAGLRPAMTLKARPLAGGAAGSRRAARVRGRLDGAATIGRGHPAGRLRRRLGPRVRRPDPGPRARPTGAAGGQRRHGRRDGRRHRRARRDHTDEFVLLGEQGGERVTAADLALVRTTISWEVLASMSARVARVYHASTGLTGLRTLAGEHLRPEERRV